MKPTHFFTRSCLPVLRLVLAGLLIAGANQTLNAKESDSSKPTGAIFATSAADGGRLVVRRSPFLGDNVSITIFIDGKSAGNMRGRTYDRYITPGRHTLIASSGRDQGKWQGTLEVRVGETYTYTASSNNDKVVLTLASGSR